MTASGGSSRSHVRHRCRHQPWEMHSGTTSTCISHQEQMRQCLLLIYGLLVDAHGRVRKDVRACQLSTHTQGLSLVCLDRSRAWPWHRALHILTRPSAWQHLNSVAIPIICHDYFALPVDGRRGKGLHACVHACVACVCVCVTMVTVRTVEQ